MDSAQPAAGGAAFDWSLTLDGALFAQPLVVGNTVIAATEGNSVYAIDATSHLILWKTALGLPVNTGQTAGCGDPNGTTSAPVGVTSTPVIDSTNNLVYVAALIKPGSSAMEYVLTALDLTSGVAHYQVPISPTSTNPNLPAFNPAMQDQRAALTLSGGRVYVSFGGLSGDCGTFRGWVWGANASDGTSPLSYEVPALASGASIWAPGGASADTSGNLFYSTGNSLQESTADHSESVLRLSPLLQESSYFTASNWSALNTADQDISSFGPLQLTNGQYSQYNGLVFQAGKNGYGYLLQGTNLGGIGGQLFSAQICANQIHGGATYMPPTIYVACKDQLEAIHLSTTGSPSFTVSAAATGFTGGNTSAASTPIWSGGLLWNLDIGALHLVMMNTTTGLTQTFALTGQPVHFASLSSGAGHIFAAAGNDLDAYLLNAGTPTPTPTPAATMTSTPVGATSTPTPSGSGTGGTLTVTFDDLSSPNRPLTGQYPSGVIDWGSASSAWYLSGPYSRFTTNSISFGSNISSSTFSFITPRTLMQLDADNGGTVSSTVTLSCAGSPNVQATLAAGQVQTLTTGWSTPCSSVTVRASNGWNTNFDNLVVANAASGSPTPAPTPSSTPAATSTSTPIATATPATSRTITFDDLQNPNRTLSGSYPSATANWGTNAWYLSGPWGNFTTNSVSFAGSTATGASVSFVAPTELVSIDAFNGGSTPSTITLGCDQLPTVTASLPAGQSATVRTGWTVRCSTLTITSANGWWTNFDNLVIH